MESSEPETVSVLLSDRLSADERLRLLLPLVYRELRLEADRLLRDERSGHTLGATALVHEAFCRLSGEREVPWANREHFYVAAAEAMRRILVDHARARGAAKRGGGVVRLSLNDVGELAASDPEQILRFDDLFSRLESEDSAAAAVLRLRFFAGLSIEHTAAALGLSKSTVDRRWAYARAWLYERLSADPTQAGDA